MRIPSSKLYRAFPELDQFSDAQCEYFVSRARSNPGTAIGLGCLPCIAFVIAFVLLFWSFIHLGEYFTQWMNSIQNETAASNLFLIMELTWIVGGSFLIGLVTRDMLYRRWVTLAIKDRINRYRCLQCKYSLLGLPVINNNHIICPECGQTITLEQLGVKCAKDLLPTSEIEDDVCPICAKAMTVDHNRCIECGWERRNAHNNDVDSSQ